MLFTDTHTHLYLKEFDSDRNKVIDNAIANGIRYILLPNIDSTSINDMLSISDEYSDNCIPMMGLHPTSVKENYKDELKIVEQWLAKRKFCAIGEIGIDLYWDKIYINEQKDAFIRQIELSIQYKLPIVMHMRNCFDEVFNIVQKYKNDNLSGVFHCFSGNVEQARKVIDLGFKIGIGGVVTFKNSGLDKVVEQIDLIHILLETDSPYLAPVPFRGKRNESTYIIYIAKKIAEIKKVDISKVASVTSNNAIKLFDIQQVIK